VGQTFTPALCSCERSVQDTVGEVRRDVAHSPSWRRRCSGRKSGRPAKCPPSSTLLHRLSEQPGTRWAAHSCEIASALLHQARKLMGLSPQTIKLRPGRANTPLGLFRMCDNLSHVNDLVKLPAKDRDIPSAPRILTFCSATTLRRHRGWPRRRPGPRRLPPQGTRVASLSLPRLSLGSGDHTPCTTQSGAPWLRRRCRATSVTPVWISPAASLSLMRRPLPVAFLGCRWSGGRWLRSAHQVTPTGLDL